MGVFDESDRFYEPRLNFTEENSSTRAQTPKHEQVLKNDSQNKAPSSQYDGAYEIFELELPKTKEMPKNTLVKKLKVPIVNLTDI